LQLFSAKFHFRTSTGRVGFEIIITSILSDDIAVPDQLITVFN
jgi:hypothetical protein